MNETVKNLALIAKQSKVNVCIENFQSRSRSIALFSGGKRIMKLLKFGLNEKTISTYKLRLLTKLNVTNLVDLVNKAKKLEIV
jgi:DNA-binding NarL/FixJ family response regulator